MRAVDSVISALRDNSATATSNWLVGEPCVAPPEALRDSLSRAATANSFPYPPPAGIPRLREILADHTAATSGALKTDQIVVTNGAKGGLLAVLAALLEPGDEMIHPAPCYPAYPAMAVRLGARPIAVPTRESTFAGWPREVANHIGPKTRVVVLSSPSNPTGATLTEEQSRTLVDLCRERGVRLVSDEAYTEFRYQSASSALAADFDPDRATVVQIRSASKSWALCGWRLGWVAADRDLAARVAARHTTLLNPASGPAQEALTALTDVPEGYLAAARRTVMARMQEVCEAIASTGLAAQPPAGGFYLWLDLSRQIGNRGTTSYCVDLARRYGIGLWPGDDFGGAGHVRLAVTAPPSDHWRRALEGLTSALA